MYKLKPIFRMPLEIQNSCPMYKLKAVHEKSVIIFNNSEKQFIIDDGLHIPGQEKDVFLKKQNEVLSTLEQLELRLSKIDINFPVFKDSLPSLEEQFISLTPCHVPNKKSESNFTSGLEDLIQIDTVVFADPEDPPYSLLALPLLWPSVLWDITYHVHSSFEKNLKALESINAFKNLSCKDIKSSIKVFVIWQHINPSPKIVRSPTDTLIGEASLLQLFNKYLASEKPCATKSNFDKVLNLINEIEFSPNDRSSELYSLINESNTNLNVENVALWSLLYKKNKVPQNVEKWLDHLTKMIIS